MQAVDEMDFHIFSFGYAWQPLLILITFVPMWLEHFEPVSLSRWLLCACLTLLTKVFFSRAESTQVFTRLKKETSAVRTMNASSRNSAIPIPIVQLHSSHHENIQILLELDFICLLSSLLQVFSDSITGKAVHWWNSGVHTTTSYLVMHTKSF